MKMTKTSLRRAAAAATGVLLLAGCGSAAPVAGKGAATSIQADPAAAVAASDSTKCDADGQPAVASIDPGTITTNPSTWSDSSTMAKIRKSGKLVVGTSGDVLLWGARNPETGQLTGFDIDVLNRIAKAIGPNVKIDYKVINYADRLPVLDDGSVQLVAHTMTINCDRWFGGSTTDDKYINFSTEYYQAGQKVLVRSGSGVQGIEDLKGKKVCVALGSTNLVNIEDKGVDAVKVADLGECLVEFQEGEVDAITGDDTVLAGFKAQDPYAEVVGKAFSVEPYGLGIGPNDVDFTKFVNAVLEDMRKDGTLADLTTHYMKGTGILPAVPKAVYGRDLRKRT
jgi:polar amino acid transport system substrate-binding protein